MSEEMRDLLPPGTYPGVVATVMDNNEGMDESTAERITDEAIKFVYAAAKHPTVYVQPSNVVDEGWHALILHTRPYAELCRNVGHFVDHIPERPDPGRHDPGSMERTVSLIESAGLTPDRALWTDPGRALVPVGANCSHTPKPSGCGPIRPGKCASH